MERFGSSAGSGHSKKMPISIGDYLSSGQACLSEDLSIKAVLTLGLLPDPPFCVDFADAFEGLV